MHYQSIVKSSAWSVLVTIVIGWIATTLVEAADISADIERLATLAGEQQQLLADSILVRVRQDTGTAIAAILPKLTDPDVNENSLAMYVTVLGMTESPRVVQNICQVAKDKESADIRNRCWTALSRIGTDEAGSCLFSSLDYVSDKKERFEVFNALAEMQYEPAVPLALEVLESNAKEDYWRPIFVFGKMGDIAVPYLIDKVGDGNKDVRYNAINVLGQWLMAPEAAQPLEAQYWKEKDPIIRNLILSSLEKVSSDQKSLLAFMNEVKSKGKDKESKDFAKETIDLIKNMSDQIKPVAAMKTDSRELFEHSYREIWESYGSDGDYQALMTASTLDDEPDLKKLRERILQRNSDESFYDFNRVNDIIALNRILYSQK